MPPWNRPGDGAEDPRLPHGQRRLRLRRRARCCSRNRPRPARAAEAARRSVSRGRLGNAIAAQVPAPHLLLGCLCAGLGAALPCGLTGSRARRCSPPSSRLRRCRLPGARGAPVRSRCLVGGCWWGSVRLDALDRSVLAGEVGRAALARARGHRPGAQERVRRPGARARPALRASRPPRAGAPRPAARARAAAGRAARGRGHGRAAARPRGSGRLRRGRVPAPPGRPRRPARRLASGSSASAAASAAVADRLRARGRARRWRRASTGERRAVIAGVVLGEDEGLDAGAARPLPRLRALPPAGRLRPERRLRRRRECSCSPGPSASRAGRGSSRALAAVVGLRARGRLAAVGRPRRESPARSPRSRGSRRGRATAGTSCSSGRRCSSRGTRTRCSSPGFQLSFAAVAAIFVARAAARAPARGLPAARAGSPTCSPSRAACGAGDGADPLAALRRDPGLLGARERARRAGRRAAPRLGAGCDGARARSSRGGAGARLG